MGGSCADCGKDTELCGEAIGFLVSSPPPSIDDIDMPPEGL